MRMPPLAPSQMSAAQRAAADELTAGPRKGVKGPFIALLRSPELLARLQKVGEFLRFGSSLPPITGSGAKAGTRRRWTRTSNSSTHSRWKCLGTTAQATRRTSRPSSVSAKRVSWN